jgi:hypothetical protein
MFCLFAKNCFSRQSSGVPGMSENLCGYSTFPRIALFCGFVKKAYEKALAEKSCCYFSVDTPRFSSRGFFRLPMSLFFTGHGLRQGCVYPAAGSGNRFGR